jgi:thioesterase domain-containing protein
MLGGCSASGIVAFETTRQLGELGHKVALLALFDTINPYFMRAYSPLRRSLTFNRAKLKRLRWSEIPGWMTAKLAYLAGTRTATSKAGTTGNNGLASAIQPAGPQFRLAEERLAAARRYRPVRHDGRFILFKCHSDLGGRYADPELGWGEAVRQVEVLQLGANKHIEIFKVVADRIIVAQALRHAFDEINATNAKLDRASDCHSGWGGPSANGAHQHGRGCEDQDGVRNQL